MNLHVEVSGRGPDLVLIHGWGLDGAIWGSFAPRLRGHRLWVVDLPGHGLSAPEPAGLTLAGAATAVTQAVPAGAVWLGWSLGALVAMAAALAGAPVAALVLIGATPRFTRARGWPHALEPSVLEAFAAELARDPEATLRRFLALQTRGADGARDTLRALRSGALRRGTPQPAALRGGLEVLRSCDLRARLAQLTMPVTAIAGERDTLVPAAATAALAAAVANGRCVRIAGAGHAPFLSHPEPCAAGVIEGLSDG